MMMMFRQRTTALATYVLVVSFCFLSNQRIELVESSSAASTSPTSTAVLVARKNKNKQSTTRNSSSDAINNSNSTRTASRGGGLWNFLLGWDSASSKNNTTTKTATAADSKKSKESKTTTTTKLKEEKKKRTNKRVGFNPFKRREKKEDNDSSKHNVTKEAVEGIDVNMSNVTTQEELEKSQLNTTSSNVTTAGGAAPNNTTSLLPDKTGGGLIVIGSPTGGPHRIYRRAIPGGPGSDLLQQQQQQQRHPSHLSQNGVLLIEVVASVLGTVTRLWLLRWVTTWLAKQEESIQPTQHFVFERLNDRHVRDAVALKNVIDQPPDGVSLGRWRRKHVRKLGRKPKPAFDLAKLFTRTVIVTEIKSDSKDGPDNEHLSGIISFLLQQHRQHAFGTNKESQKPLDLEVVFLVQSPGGSVSAFGLTAAQIYRLSKEPGISTTVCVDKYAASGGYMIASQAHSLIAAPFASVGSIGVIMEGLNFNEIAKRYGIQPLVIKSGDSKNPFTTFGDVSRHDMLVEKEHLEKVHEAFKDLIVEGRPVLANNINEVSDGSVYLGTEALELKLVDRVMTSSEYILERIGAGDRVLQLHRTSPMRFQRRTILHPIDILPHLRAWISSKLQSQNHAIDSSEIMSWLVQTGSLLGFMHHVFIRYFNQNY